MTIKTIPPSVTQAAGNLITGATWNAGAVASTAFLTNVPIFAGTSTVALSVASVGMSSSGSYTSVPLNVTIVDSENGHSNVANSSQYVVQVQGWYMISGAVAWSNNTTGDRGAMVAVNGFAVTESINTYIASPGSDVTTVPTRTVIELLNPTDYVELQCSQSSGGALSTAAAATAGGSATGSWLHIWWVSHP